MNEHVTRNIVEYSGEVKKVVPLPIKDEDTMFPRVKEALGGEAAWEQLPVLKKCPVGPTGYLDKLVPADLSDITMRGEDEYGRPFVAFIVGDHVETIFRRYKTGSVWVPAGAGNVGFPRAALDNSGLARVRFLMSVHTGIDKFTDKLGRAFGAQKKSED